jgi:hypothetical protein
MIKTSCPVVQLNDHLAKNWTGEAQPVAILNPECSTHEKVAYCWGLAATLNAVTELGIDSKEAEVRAFASLVSSSLAPLLAVLEHLGDETCPAEMQAQAGMD